tara:strand:- start:1776 stop:1889 length:114 start_codon:yes stop_codon:yes gene_type:complete
METAGSLGPSVSSLANVSANALKHLQLPIIVKWLDVN